MSHTKITIFTLFLCTYLPWHPRFTFWFNLFPKLYVTFFSGLLSYLVGMKRETSKHVTCKRNNSYFLPYILISPDVRDLPFGYHFFKVVRLLCSSVYGFRDEEEDQVASYARETILTFFNMYLSPL